MFVKHRSETLLCGSNLEVVRQIVKLKVLNISQHQRDVSAFVFVLLLVRLTKTGKEQIKGGKVERLAMSKLWMLAASWMEIRHIAGDEMNAVLMSFDMLMVQEELFSNPSTLELSCTFQSSRIHLCNSIFHLYIFGPHHTVDRCCGVLRLLQIVHGNGNVLFGFMS